MRVTRSRAMRAAPISVTHRRGQSPKLRRRRNTRLAEDPIAVRSWPEGRWCVSAGMVAVRWGGSGFRFGSGFRDGFHV